MKILPIRWYTITNAKKALRICYIRFKDGGIHYIRWHTLTCIGTRRDPKLFLSVLKICAVVYTLALFVSASFEYLCNSSTAIINILILQRGDRLYTSESDVYRRTSTYVRF